MRYWIGLCTCLFVAVSLIAGTVGCARSSHTSVRINEYDEPPRDRQADEELDSEYKMVSPGEMVGPGEMTDE